MLKLTDTLLNNMDKWEVGNDERLVALDGAPPEVVKDIDEINKTMDEAESDPETHYDI